MSNELERLTVKQLSEKYPDTWVVLQNVKYKPNNASTIESAEVYKSGLTEHDAIALQIRNKGLIAWYTTEKGVSIGMIGAL